VTAREEANIKIFTEWTNYVLQPLDITIKHLCKDLADGIILSHMCKQLSGKSPKSINTKPTTDSQKTTNIQFLLDTLRSDKCIVDVAAVDIVLGNPKQTIVLLTAMAERYQIGDRADILAKLGDIAAKHKLELNSNLVKSVADGKLIAAVILSCLPDTFDIQLVNNMYIEERVTYVTQLANKKIAHSGADQSGRHRVQKYRGVHGVLVPVFILEIKVLAAKFGRPAEKNNRRNER